MSSATTEQQPVQDNEDLKCPVHTASNVLFHCENCNRLVCAVCATDQHKGHSFGQFTGIAEQSINFLTKFLENTNKVCLSNTEQSIEEVIKKEKKIEENKISLLQQIAKNFGILHEQLQKAQTNLEDRVNSSHQEQREKLKKVKEELVISKDKLQTRSQNLTQIFRNGTLVEKFDISQSLQEDKEEERTMIIVPDINRFKIEFGGTNVTNFVEALSNNMLKGLPSNPLKCANNITSTKKISICFNYITPISETKAWCVHNTRDKVCLINDQGEVEQVIQTSDDINYLCLHPISKVLCASFNDYTIRTIDTITGSTHIVLKCSNIPQAFTITPSGDIIVAENGYLHRYSNGQLLNQSKEKNEVYDISCSDKDHVAIATGQNGVLVLNGALTNIISKQKYVSYGVVYDKDGGLVFSNYRKNTVNILYGENFSKIRAFTPPNMFDPERIRLFNNSLWVKCNRFILNVMFQ